MNNAELQYLNILQKILIEGKSRVDRTGTGSISIFGESIRHDYTNGFPLLTTKKISFKNIITELLWFIKGTDDPQYLFDNNNPIWNEWIVDGKLPHTYGQKWRNFYGIDQISNLISELKTNPYSRRHVVTTWDPPNIKNCALPWCHIVFQLYAEPESRQLSISVLQRSADFFLGVPFNIASYSFLLNMICSIIDYSPKQLYYTFNDCHIYNNHIDQCKLQLSRVPYQLPVLLLKKKDNVDDFVLEDFTIENYQHHPFIKGDVSI